ncbi:guanine nucleotide-binding protein-like 3 homolog [Pecten maximus]|uniref:guanine nucleotide-binding protein-like 3 homolog n=1 Tax=Pecten maximus TaxID=6579 RepID=UPI001458C303|nr:guanine nucleotide-binding protein-like 3 homolog [Pecten maximus]
MPEGLPDELWTDYRTFFWDNRTGLYFGGALFGLGLVTLILGGFVSLCKRAIGGKSVTMKVSKNQRRSIDNPLYIMDSDETSSREVLVGAEAGTAGHQGDSPDLEIEEQMEEPMVIYENEQFFLAAKRTKTSDAEDVIPTEETRNRKPRYAYSQVIKKSNERARKKKEGGEARGSDERSKGKKREAYSQVIKKENEKSKPTPKQETDDVPEVPKKRFGDTKTSEKANEKDDDEISGERRETAVDDNDVEDHSDDGTSEDVDPNDYVNVSAPKILSLGDDVYLDMSYREQEADPDDYINCTNIKNPST